MGLLTRRLAAPEISIGFDRHETRVGNPASFPLKSISPLGPGVHRDTGFTETYWSGIR